MKISYLSSAFLAFALFTQNVLAEEPVRVIGNLPAKLIITPDISPPPNSKKPHAAGARTTQDQEVSEVKSIMLQHIKLSSSAQQYLDQKVNAIDAPTYFMTASDSNSTTTSVQLNMNNVPVLDQGVHGACVTFATTAILDALYNKGDYISQLCNLELTATLYPATSEGPHGWEGSSNFIILEQINRYGIIPKEYQKSMGCAGVREYPLYERRNWGNPMTVEEFTSHSEPVTSTMSSKTILDMSNAFSARSEMAASFDKVKQALANGHRVLIAFLVDQVDGGAGALGKYKVRGDTWIVTPTIKKDILGHKVNAGHAIIITGFDDNAKVLNMENGHITRGVFKLRNSWGKHAGDNGEYYMSYDYFKLMIDEVIEIQPAY